MSATVDFSLLNHCCVPNCEDRGVGSDAERVAEELVAIFARLGIPKEILTDQGSNFQSQLLAELYKLLHVEAIQTSPYHPQTDGLVERFNQTLKQMLKKTAAEEGNKLIPFLLFTFREVPQESTGIAPFELLYGREVRGPLDIKEYWEPEDAARDQNVVAYVMMMRN
jgi:transposase InsO family protein